MKQSKYSYASLSMAYAHVCEWVKDPKAGRRPKPDELETAKVQAKAFGDEFLLGQIDMALKYWERTDRTKTPEQPMKAARPDTKTYLTHPVDRELDNFLKDMEEFD